LEKAIALNPNYADAIAGLGEVLNWAGRPDEAIGLIQRAMRLNPHHHAWYLWALGISYASTNRNEEAIELMKRGLIRSPDFLGIHLQLAFLYAETGKNQEAQREVE
jgi:tetratricopeptide (TPR) repeat protein